MQYIAGGGAETLLRDVSDPIYFSFRPGVDPKRSLQYFSDYFDRLQKLSESKNNVFVFFDVWAVLGIGTKLRTNTT